jgi:hypothetical protein
VCYNDVVLKLRLIHSNPHLRTKTTRKTLIQRTVVSSTTIETGYQVSLKNGEAPAARKKSAASR